MNIIIKIDFAIIFKTAIRTLNMKQKELGLIIWQQQSPFSIQLADLFVVNQFDLRFG